MAHIAATKHKITDLYNFDFWESSTNLEIGGRPKPPIDDELLAHISCIRHQTDESDIVLHEEDRNLGELFGDNKREYIIYIYIYIYIYRKGNYATFDEFLDGFNRVREINAVNQREDSPNIPVPHAILTPQRNVSNIQNQAGVPVVNKALIKEKVLIAEENMRQTKARKKQEQIQLIKTEAIHREIAFKKNNSAILIQKVYKGYFTRKIFPYLK